ncbi:MAG: sulfatase [Proteobacteria bacterium]|nr:sulfatase [Pseudomonadota bacterium]
MRALAALALLALLPPTVFAAFGGADLDLASGWRVSWFEVWGPALGVAAAGLLAGLAPRAHWPGALALPVLAVLAAVCWTGPIAGPGFSVGDPLRPGAVALALTLVGCGATRRRWRPGGAVHMAAAGLAAAGVALSALALDARDLASRFAAASKPGISAPHVILVVADTLRADALGLYGANPSPSPFLDRYLAAGTVWEHAFAQAPWTYPSMASLMTSRYPSTLDPVGRGRSHNHGHDLPRLPEDIPRLALALQRAGYATAGVQKNPFLAAGSGFEQGFHVYEAVGGNRAELRAAAQTTDAALRVARAWSRRHAGDEAPPFFLYAHYMDPHIDYRPPAAYRAADTRAYAGDMDGRAKTVHRAIERAGGPTPDEVAQMRRLYRDEVRYLDSQVERLHAGLTELGLIERDTWFVFVSDHGEQFGEHGRFEHADVHVENTHVPLAITGGEARPQRIPGPSPLLDLTPTLLDLLGLPPLPGAEGTSQAAVVTGRAVAGTANAVITEFGREQRLTTARYVLLRRGTGAQLFDGSADPREARDVAAAHPGVMAQLESALVLHAQRTSAPAATAPSRPLDDETRRALEALGYLDD